MANENITKSLQAVDSTVAQLLLKEMRRQNDSLPMIASENYTSLAVMQAVGSVFANKYAEGYPGKRYYQGCDVVDEIETLAIRRACEVFGCGYANVQAHAGSQANQAVMMAFLEPGDSFLGMSLSAGGHLTHGHPINISGKWFDAKHYGVNDDGWIDMNVVSSLAQKYKPKMIIAGASAYARTIDFAAFRDIADRVGSIFLADIAHYAGLIAGKAYADPIPHAHVCTFTTHKTLRGPRGAIITCNDEELAKKIDRAVFPGLQGGPFMNNIAARAVMLKECQQEDFRLYAQNTVKYARFLAAELMAQGIPVLTGGTDSHIIMVNFLPLGLSGHDIANSLSNAGIIVNKNSVPNDTQPPSITSGIRIGTAACVTRGLGADEFKQIAAWIAQIVRYWIKNHRSDPDMEERIRKELQGMLKAFPVY